MRHIGTLIAAIVIGPLAWILIAYGQDRSAEAFTKAGSGGAFDTGDFVQPLIYLAVAGLILGLISTLRYSPLGAVLTGAVYAASYVLLLINPKWEFDLFTGDISVFGHDADPRTPVRTGTTLLIGALLLVAVVSIGRWRSWPRPVADPTTDTLIPESPTFTGLPPAGSDLFGTSSTSSTTTGSLGTTPGSAGSATGPTGSTTAWTIGASTGKHGKTDKTGDTTERISTAQGEAEQTSTIAEQATTGSPPGPSTSPWTLPPRERPTDPTS